MRHDGLLFSYPGSKWRLAKKYQELYAPHRVYVDVFGGSAAMIARQQPRTVEVYNDLDHLVSNVFSTVKDTVARQGGPPSPGDHGKRSGAIQGLQASPGRLP